MGEIQSEFAQWEDPFIEAGRDPHDRRTVHPPVESPNSLPTGWHLVATRLGFYPGEDVHLVVRDGGDAVLMSRTHATNNTSGFWFFKTIGDMYDHIRFKRDGGVCEWGVQNKPQPSLVTHTDWLESVMTDMYDPTDPEEAGEPVLLALGAPFTRVPASAYKVTERV